MQLRPFAALQTRTPSQAEWPPTQPEGRFFDLHPVGAVLRSLFLSSLLWIFLAFTVYTVYTIVLAAK